MSTTPHRSKAMASRKIPESPLSVIRTPESVLCRRSLRLAFSPRTTSEACHTICEDNVDKKGTAKKSKHLLFSPEKTPSKRSFIAPTTPNPSQLRKKRRNVKKRSDNKKLVCDGGEFEVGDDVYVRRRDDADFDEDDPEVEECRICFEIGSSLMIECEDCLGGFHLQCLKPPLHEVPKGDWICEFCEAKKSGKKVKLLRPSDGEKLLSGDIWAAKIESAGGGMSRTPHRSEAKASKKIPESALSVIRTPESASCRRSLRLAFSPQTTPEACHTICEDNVGKKGTAKKSRHLLVSPEKTPSKRSSIAPATPNPSQLRKKRRNAKKRSYYKKLVCDGGEFKVGEDVYVKRKDDAESDEDDPEVEECRICFEIGSSLMIECEDCLGGFHLQCLKPPLHEVPKGDWICEFCEAKKSGRKVKFPRPSDGEKLLSSDIWAAKIESAGGGMSRTPHRSEAKVLKKIPESSLSVIRTPESASCRRSLRLAFSPQTISEACHTNCEDNVDKMGTAKISRHLLFSPEKTPSKRSSIAPATPNPSQLRKKRRNAKKRSYYKKLVCDGGEFKVGDDVYVRRRDDAESDEDDPEVEECRICFEIGSSLMIECEDCLGGFHLQCLKPPLLEVPEGDWICEFCEAKKLGKKVKLPMPSDGKKLRRTMREKLLSGDLWAAKIESLWKELDGTYWLKCRWYVIPEETTSGRQPHNLRRELYLTNHLSGIEIESVLRHCYVMNPREFAEANNEGDDVFYCEYEYDVRWHSFKRVSEVADTDNDDEAEKDGDWKYSNDSGCDSEGDSDFDDDTMGKCSSQNAPTHELAANSRRGRIFGLHKIGLKKIPEHVRLHKPTDLERAKSTLLLTALPKTLPCRTKEMEEITLFIKGAICEDHCLGRCLYIHGVPGTGKTMTALTVLRNLRAEVDAGRMRPYCFVEVNGLKLSSPENIYRVIYEAMSGHRVGWKKALGILNERFSEGVKISKEENRPCILLIDELDLLLTRNQSVLYNIFDWPSKPYSKLIVIGIANTMDLPEKFLPRISSRLGIQRLCFGPYNYQQLQEIIASRLKGVDAFEEQAIEFASRKVAAMSGDARRALEICRRAAEVAEYRIRRLSQSSNGTSLRDSLSEGKHLVGLNDVEAAIHEVFQAPHIQVMKTSSRLSKVLLTAMVHELYRSGLGEVSFEKLATTIRSLCSSNREPVPKWDDLLKVSCKLGECRIILSEDGTKHRLRRMQLNFPSDDVTFALKDCPEISWLSKYL